MRALHVLLLALVSLLAVHDLRTRQLPNWATLPMLAAGVLLDFPGQPETWLGCLLLFAGWRFGALGGGDAKLWMGLLWLAQPVSPMTTGGAALLAMCASLAASALAQLIWRAARRRPAVGVQGWGAWRALPFALWLLAAG